ncbi:MAG TPA: hydrogenase formation protein HypD [Candidatus Omnitrophota bacterium]|nr:hydrogenase formation protein HypD [Candidatus Omnitrophota bacterium]
MRFVDEFRDKRLIKKIAVEIRAEADPRRHYRFMEVCGTHTMNIFRFGLRDILPSNIELVSGPGCPVCVTPNSYIDKAIWLARQDRLTVAAFGDMFRVPGSYSSLEKEKASGASIKIVYSSLDALALARRHRDREVVFLGVGFETTIPTVAEAIMEARRDKIDNFSVLCGHKTMPEALRALVLDRDMDIHGFLLPGHVSAITGSRPYRFLTADYSKGCVISGFEPIDILQSILMLVRQDRPRLGIQYTRIINEGGNPIARMVMSRVFEPVASEWRGIGAVKNSGLKIRNRFAAFDAERRFNPKPPAARHNRSCICGAVLKGLRKPNDCKLFGKACVPSHPVGACMVSSEGACAAYFKYNDKKV